MSDVLRCVGICRDILDRLPRGADEGGWEKVTSRWTKRLVEQIRVSGVEAGYEVRPHPDAPRSSGWLYDVVWLRRDADQSLLRAFLVAESEWDPSPVKIFDDFEKLLLARADIRVMVFNRRKHTQVLATLDEMERRIRGFEQTERTDMYLLCGLSWDTGSFEYREYSPLTLVRADASQA